MTVVYREGKDVDLVQLAELFEEAGWGARTTNQESFDARVRQSHFVVSAWEGERLVGFTRAISDGIWVAYVSDVVVRASHRRRGIGGELVRRLMDGHDDVKFLLHALPSNHPFYAKLGFEPAPNVLVRRRTSERDVERFFVKDVDPDRWANERDGALARVRAVVPFAEVHEVGSTAIPGVLGKQDIDVLVRVPRSEFERAREILDAAFARHPNQLSNTEYQAYVVDGEYDVAIQLTIIGSRYDDFLAFRDALRADPALVERYNTLKRRWHGEAMDDYREAKAEFVRDVLASKKNAGSP